MTDTPDTSGGTVENLARWVEGPTGDCVETRIAATLRALARERDELRTEVDRVSKLVYVPGLWRCPKCKFCLHQRNLNARDGTVTARDTPGDKCPNCAGPLWRVTERDAGNEMIDRAEEAFDDKRAAIARAEAAEARLSEAMSERAVLVEVARAARAFEAATQANTQAAFDRLARALDALPPDVLDQSSD